MAKRFKFNLLNKDYVAYYIINPQEAESAAKKLIVCKSPLLGADLETGKLTQFHEKAGLDPRLSFISLAQFYDGEDTVYMIDTHFCDNWKILTQQILEAKQTVFHNALFDVAHLTHNEIYHKGCKPVNCSLIAYYLYKCAAFVDEADEMEDFDSEFFTKSDTRGGGLKAVVAKLLGIYVDKEPQASNWTDRPLNSNQLFYAIKDSIFTYKIWEIIRNYLVEYNLQKVYVLNRNAIPAVVRCQLTGMYIDQKLHSEHVIQWTKDLAAEKLLVEKALPGVVNIRSTPQMSVFVKTNVKPDHLRVWPTSEKTGRFSADAKTLMKWSPQYPWAKQLLSYRKLDKMVSTYGEKILTIINPETKRLHPGFTLGWTQTGRMSGRQPNIQNLPRDSKIREIFVAAPGNVLVAADYSQIENRIIAYMSGDKKMLQAFREGIDLYAQTAALILNKPIDKVTKQERQIFKSITLGTNYGLGAKGLGEYIRTTAGIPISDDEAQRFWYKYFSVYSGLATWQEKTRRQAQLNGYTISPYGKRRKVDPEKCHTVPVNHPIQAASAEMILDVVIECDKKFSNKVMLLAPIHDEMLLETTLKIAPKAGEILVDIMKAAVLKVLPHANSMGIMDNIVDYKIGNSWQETK